jgi:hypothetical protein
MWWDRRKRHTVSFKVDEYELGIIKDTAEEFGESKGEAVRRALWATRILFDPKLLLRDAVRELDWDKPLADILKPIPELSAQIGLELAMWRKAQGGPVPAKEVTR